MKNFSRLRVTFLAASILFLGSCSKATYTFAPNTGTYHGAEKAGKAVAATDNAVNEEVTTASVSAGLVKPAALASAHEDAATTLATAFTAKAQKDQNVTITDKKSAKTSINQLTKDLKQLSKKEIKESKRGGLGLSTNVKLLLVLGLAFVLLGALLNLGIIYAIGGILLIIALVLFLMEIL